MHRFESDGLGLYKCVVCWKNLLEIAKRHKLVCSRWKTMYGYCVILGYEIHLYDPQILCTCGERDECSKGEA